MPPSKPVQSSGRRGTWRLATLALIGSILLAGSTRGDEPIAPSENQVIASYLINFLMFIAPDQPAARQTYTLAIVGTDPFGTSFDSAESQPLDKSGRKLLVVRFRTYDETAAQKLRDCDLVFITTSEQRHTKDILTKLNGAPTITVSDNQGFLEAGGMVRILLQDNKIRWEINTATLKAAGLSASAQLCRNAARVLDAPAKRDNGS